MPKKTTSKRPVQARASKVVAKPKTAAKPKAAPSKPAAAAKKPPAEPAPKLRTKSPYSRTQLNPLRVALLALRGRVAGDLDMMGGEALRASDPEVDADEVADLGTDAFERTMTLNLMENDARMLQKIDDALAAMDAGRYGLCLGCNSAIALSRLEALPFAQTCVPCQEEQERLQ